MSATLKPGGVDGATGWELLRIADIQRRVRLPARLPAGIAEQALWEQMQQILTTLLAIRMWDTLPAALLTRVG